MFRRRFWVSLALTVPTVLYSSMVQDWLGYTAPEFPGHTFVAPLFGTLVFLWGGPRLPPRRMGRAPRAGNRA